MVDNFYFLVIAVLFIVVIKTLFKKTIKVITVDEEIKEHKKASTEINDSKIVEIKINNSKMAQAETNEPIIVQMPSKNKWLYTSDDFGRMEEGVVEDSITYVRNITNEEEEEEDFFNII